MKQKINSIISTVREKHLVARFSSIKDFVFAAIKIIFGIFISSFFLGISGIYSICIGLAGSVYLSGIKEGGDEKKEYQCYLKMALLILSGSIIYVIYMARLFFVKALFSYPMIPAITIAAVSFTELTLSVKNIIKAQGILQKGLRCVSLTSSYTAIVLTQVAILSFAYGDTAMAAFFNAVSGCAFGGMCILIGLGMIRKYLVYNKMANSRQKPADSDDSDDLNDKEGKKTD